MTRSALKRLISIIPVFTAIIVFSIGALSQTIQPAATPTPVAPTIDDTQIKPRTSEPTAAPTPLRPTQDDTQNVAPDKLQGVPDVAPGYRYDDRKLPDLGRVGVDMAEQKPMTLRDTLQLALENNKDIDVTRKNVRIAEYDFRAARGYYEPRFSGTSYYERAKTPSTSFFGGGPNGSTTQDSLVSSLQVDGYYRPQGTTFRASVVDQNINTNNLFTTLNPLYVTTASFSLVQPLFRGRNFDTPRRNIEVAKKNLSLSDSQFRQRTIEVIASVQRAYWDLTFALRNLQVQRDAVRDAKDQLEHNKRLVNEGQLAPIDVVAAETQVANFELGVYDALDNVNRAENVLKGLIAPNKSDAIWNVALVPVDPVDNDVPPTTLDEALTAALQNRPEIQQNDIAKDINQLDQKLYKDQTKPQIDFTASYLLNGTAGSLSNTVNPFSASSADSVRAISELITRINALSPNQTPISPLIPSASGTLPANLVGGYSDVFGNIFANRYPTLRFGLQFNLPLFGNQTARAQFGHARVEGERIQTLREQLEQNIQIDVRNALQTLRTSEARLRAAGIARDNSQKQYDSERRKLDEGQSTLFLVLERQTALANARGTELRAQTELNKAIADLQRATGNSMQANSIVLDSDRKDSRASNDKYFGPYKNTGQ
jgi:outer membrane protein